MTERMFAPPRELASLRQRFDPIREAERYGLARDVALALWAEAQASEADLERAARRFHALAARRASTPIPGKRTRTDDDHTRMASTELRDRVPGRETLATIEGLRRRDPAALRAQLARTFGPAAGDVAIAADAARAVGAEGVAIGEQVYIAPGYYDLTTLEGRERLGHEVAHALQQRRGRHLPAQLSVRDRAGLEAEADHAGRAFARGQRFAVQGRAPGLVALFKGATPAKPAAATTTIDLKSGGRIERKAPAAAQPGDKPAATSAKETEKLVVSYGGVQASAPLTIERNDSGEAVKLVGRAKISLPASTYLKQLDLDIALAPDGTVTAKLSGNSASTIKIGGLTVHGGRLTATIAHGQLGYALDGATISLPKQLGEGALSIQGNGDKPPAFDASLAINVPKMQQATMSFHADDSGYRAEGSAGVDIKQASGSVRFALEKVGADKALWSAAGSVGYNSERLSGQLGVQYNADGELSGEGQLAFQIADFLTGQANVAVDKEGHVTVNGEIRPPAETQLFPEKKVENTFFHKSLEFPIWGISIPAVGSVGLIAFIEGSMGYRVGVGAGVMRDIVLSGQYSTDPSVQPTFQISGEIFIPAFAELLISIGGGIKLDAFIAEVGGGIKIDGRAGMYGGLSVRPTLAYEGGKYRLSGQALVAGDVGLSAQVDAFVRLHVGKWMFSWEKEWDWKLGEWNKWLGLNLGMEADLDYTLGQPLSPDIFKLKKPDSLDVQGIAKSAMPQGGMPPQGPKGAQNQRTEFHAKGGAAAPAASSNAAQPKVAGTPAGAAGHKNQDPKGKNVKPGKPPKPAPPKNTKGKDPSQTGPNPKNNSKPTQQKLDPTPIVESFSMHGEPHQLIVQLGPGGHVDMASKRERLSVKVGHAVGKLIAKHASPQQVSDLKALGELAKKGDQMVAKAKLTDKPGTQQVAQKIAAYGNKWQVKDLDEVAIKAPRTLVAPSPVRLAKLNDNLNKALGTAHAGQAIAQKSGDAKEVTRQLLDQHKDASFDFASARLTLPALKAAPLQSAQSANALGQQLAQQSGVSKIVVKASEQGGVRKLDLVGSIGSATASLGTAEAVPVAKSLAAKPVQLAKINDALAKSLGAAQTGQSIYQGAGDPASVTRQLMQRHPDAHFDWPSAKLTLPNVQPGALQAAQSAEQLGQALGQQTGVSKVTLHKRSNGDYAFVGAINPETELAEAKPGDPMARLRDAIAEAEALMDEPDATRESVQRGLEPIRAKLSLSSLELQQAGSHESFALAKINPQLPSRTKKLPSADELAAIRAHSAKIADLWRRNGVADQFLRASPARRADLLLDENSYRRPGGQADAPDLRVGDLVEATAEPGLRIVAAETGGTLLVQPKLYLADEAGQPLGGVVDEIDFLLIGPAEVRLVSAKLRVGQFKTNVDRRKLELLQRVPDNPAAAGYVANYMGWGDRARTSDRAQTAGAVVWCAGMAPMRANDFRARYLNRERTQSIVIEPVAPHGQGQTPKSEGYSLRITLTDLLDLYVKEIKRIL